jgi:hypothetical protein
MPLSANEIDGRSEKFIRFFVFLFEEHLLNYRRSIVEKIPKPGKWADLVSCVIRIVTTGTLLSATSATSATVGAPVGASVGAPTSASLLLPLISLAVSDMGVHYNRKRLIKIINLLDFYHENQENKIKIRKNLIEAAILITRSFEIKFSEVTVHGSYQLAILKLAHDAVDRAFNFFKENSPILEEAFFAASHIVKAVILGKSKRYRNIFSLPKRHLGGSLDNGLTTKQLYQETPILKIVDPQENYCYQKKHARDISDFRLVFEWEEADNAIQWGIDDEIMLFGNRQYKKSIRFTATNFNRLNLLRLTEEELEAKKTSLFDIINQHHGAEEVIKQQLEEINKYIRNDMTDGIANLETDMAYLKDILLILIENVTVSEERQADFQNNIESLKISMFPRMGGEFFCEAMLTQLRQRLSVTETIDDPGLYLPLEGCYDPAAANKIRFPLRDEVIVFLKEINHNTLLILGEAGSGKTSFLIYLTQYVLKNPIFSIQGSRILPLYIGVSSIPIRNQKTTSIMCLLKEYYDVNTQEIESFFKDKQQVFCFIFDDIDESNINPHIVQELYNDFPKSHCIFTARLSRFKLKGDGENLWVSINDSAGVREKTIHLAPFNEISKRNYIHQFLKKKTTLALAASYQDADEVYRRIKAIPCLNDIIGQAIFLMITMEVFTYLESFYRQEKTIPEFKHIKKDLLHMYTHLLYTEAAHHIQASKGINSVNGVSIYDGILTYTVKLAQLMTETGIKEIDENLLFAGEDSFASVAHSARTPSNVFLKLTPWQYREYKRCFAKKYDPQLFKDGDDFKAYKYGYQGCVFLHSYGEKGNVSYVFSHPKFLNYFCTFDKERRNKIQKFIDNHQVLNSLQMVKMRRSSSPASVQDREVRPLLARQLSSPTNPKLGKGFSLRTLYMPVQSNVNIKERETHPLLARHLLNQANKKLGEGSSVRSPYTSVKSSIKGSKESSLGSLLSSSQSSTNMELGEKSQLRSRHHSAQSRVGFFAATTSRVSGRASYFSTMIDPTLDDVPSDAHTAQSGFL